jgi:hypothetical protein
MPIVANESGRPDQPREELIQIERNLRDHLVFLLRGVGATDADFDFLYANPPDGTRIERLEQMLELLLQAIAEGAEPAEVE